MWADIVFECAGSPTTFQQSIEMTHGGGKVMLVGLYDEPLSWDPSIAVNKSLTLIGCMAGHFPGAIELLQTGRVNTKPFVSHEFPLEKVKEAFETQLGAQDAVKVLVKL